MVRPSCVPAKLSARARVFATGQARKADPVDAHSVAVVALRTEELTGIGPSGAGRFLGDIGDVYRFTSRAHFAS